MKNFLLFSILFTCNVFSQGSYTLQKDAIIYDIPGGEFLTVVMIDDTVFIKHYDLLGNILWEDSLSFAPSISPVYFNDIARFKNTDEYIISTYADPTPSTTWYTFANDTLVYQFSKFNLSTHTFDVQLVDTFIGQQIDLIEIKDTSIYFLVTDFSMDNDPNPFNQVTYSLNSSMNISLIAPMDSVVTLNMLGWSINVFGDSIYRYQSFQDVHLMNKYSLQMSNLQLNSCSVPTSQDVNYSYYRKMYNGDSLFILTEGTTSGSPAVEWRMDWRNLSLSSINSTVFNSPNTNNPPNQYFSTFNNVAVDRSNRKIMVMSNNSTLGSNVIQKIFVYDFNFNPVCEIPVTIGSNSENTLIELNDLVYLRNDNSSTSKLIRIDCAMLSIEEMITNTEFQIFPNPTQSNIFISNPDQKNLSIVVFSSDGKQLIQLSQQESNIKLDLENLHSGIYLVEINDGSKTETKRIFKE